MIYANLVIANPARGELKPMPVRALVDTGSAHLCIPRSVQLQLGLTRLDERQVVLPDGRSTVVDYVGPVAIGFATRTSFAGALVIGEQVLLGTIALADLDLVVRVREGDVVVNGDSPNIPVSGALPQRNKARR
ncbi:clan AA aspartic protease [uncultured Sphingomonas sp.]|uniref:clan AA aspartic protease n=1 Tax=uncultured Sphingomonas sp. TaxID=158754 RepID=UPI0035C94F4C